MNIKSLSSKKLDKCNQNKARLQLIESAVINFAMLISPVDAVWSVPILKLCFMLLKFLQES